MKLYLFVFNSAKFGAFFALFGAIFGVEVRFKNILEPANVDYPIFLNFIQQNFGPFCTFWALGGHLFWSVGAIFGVEVRFKNISGTY